MDGLTISTADSLLETGRTVSDLQKSKQSAKVEPKDGKSFADTLSDAIQSVNELQKQADVMMQKLSTGEAKNIPEVLIAAEKADIALKLMIQVRNKVIDAYQEVMKMQV